MINSNITQQLSINNVMPSAQSYAATGTSLGNGVSFADLLNGAKTSTGSTQPTGSTTMPTIDNVSTLDNVIGRNYLTASRLAGALQASPERWEQINKDAGLGLSEADMTHFWNMNTAELTDTLMKLPPAMYSNLTQATYGADFISGGWNLPQVVSGVTPEGVKNRDTFPQFNNVNSLKIENNFPSGFNPSYGRRVEASEYANGLARWGSNPHFDATAIMGGNGTLPTIPNGVGTTIASSNSSQLSAYSVAQQPSSSQLSQHA